MDTISKTNENKNGILHPHVSNASSPMVILMPKIIERAKNKPMDAVD
jgi:hypothetical protein